MLCYAFWWSVTKQKDFDSETPFDLIGEDKRDYRKMRKWVRHSISCILAHNASTIRTRWRLREKKWDQNMLWQITNYFVLIQLKSTDKFLACFISAVLNYAFEHIISMTYFSSRQGTAVCWDWQLWASSLRHWPGYFGKYLTDGPVETEAAASTWVSCFIFTL